MLTIGQLWKHKTMQWLEVRVMEVHPQFGNRPTRMVDLKVENRTDDSTNGLEIQFDDEYVMSNYYLIEGGLDNPHWEV